MNGILYHSGFSDVSKKAFTLEGQVVKYSDKIAYVNHDIDDSLRAGILSMDSIPKDILQVLGDTHGERVDTLVKDCIYTTTNNIKENDIQVALSINIDNKFKKLRDFMFKEVYNGEFLKEERDKARFILIQLYKYFYSHEEKLPEFYKSIAKNEGLNQGVADYIAGMSDDYCINIFNNLYVPKFVIY